MTDLSLLSVILRFSWFRIFFSIILLLLFSKVLQILIFFTDGNKIHTYFKGRKSHGNRFFSPREFSFWLIAIFKSAATDTRYFIRSEFSRSLAHKDHFGLTWQVVFKLEYLFYQRRWGSSFNPLMPGGNKKVTHT